MHLKTQLRDLENYDTLQVEKRRKDNQRLKRDLDECRNEHGQGPTHQPDTQTSGKSLQVSLEGIATKK